MSEAKHTYICSTCGSTNVKWDAWASWDVEFQELEMHCSFDQPFCDCCEGECGTVKVLYPLQIKRPPSEGWLEVANVEGGVQIYAKPPEDDSWGDVP